MAKTIHFKMSLYLFCEKASKGKLSWFRNEFCFILPTCIIQSRLPFKTKRSNILFNQSSPRLARPGLFPHSARSFPSFISRCRATSLWRCGRPSNHDIPATASEALLLTATSASQLTQAPVGDRLVPQLRQEWTLFQQRSTLQNTLADLTTRLGLQYMFSAMGQKFLLTPIYVNPFFL